MAQSELQVTARENVGKGAARSLRRQGLVPAVVYGKGMDTCTITVDPKDLNAALANEAGLNTLITLKGDGAFAGKTVLLVDSQVHPIRRDIEHVDFKTIDVTVQTSVWVPVVTLGTPEGEKLGGTMNLIRHELEVHCLPTAIPESIEIDVSALNIGDVIHVDEIPVPEGVTIPFDVNFTVVTCMARLAEEVEETEDEEEVAVVADAPDTDVEE
jgi:large subunit ribosomal protein L25